MAGIIHKIEEKLGMGGHKEADNKHCDEHKVVAASHDDHKHGDKHGCVEHKPEHKEGFVEKIKDKILGDGGEHCKDEKKKKKEKKKKEHGHEGHSSSSDSDSD